MANPEKGPREPGKEMPVAEQPQIKTEKKESPVDTAYLRSVENLFDRHRDEQMSPDTVAIQGTETSVKVANYMSALKRSLSELANNKRLVEIQPKEVSFALACLVGDMSLGLGQVDRGASEIGDKGYLESRDLFMASCRKLFPEIQPEMNGGIPKAVEKKLEESAFLVSAPSLGEGDKLLGENPKKLKELVDGMFVKAGNQMSRGAFEASTNGKMPAERVGEMQNNLGGAAEAMYKLQLMRDALTKRIYGRADITPSEAKEMDEARAKVK